MLSITIHVGNHGVFFFLLKKGTWKVEKLQEMIFMPFVL